MHIYIYDDDDEYSLFCLRRRAHIPGTRCPRPNNPRCGRPPALGKLSLATPESGTLPTDGDWASAWEPHWGLTASGALPTDSRSQRPRAVRCQLTLTMIGGGEQKLVPAYHERTEPQPGTNRSADGPRASPGTWFGTVQRSHSRPRCYDHSAQRPALLPRDAPGCWSEEGLRPTLTL